MPESKIPAVTRAFRKGAGNRKDFPIFLELCEALKIAAGHQEGLSHGLKIRDLMTFEFLSDALKASDRLL